jgi:quercetin 2,3-dioxygenase
MTIRRAHERGRLRLVASGNGQNSLVSAPQDVRRYVVTLAAGDEGVHRLSDDRHACVHVIRGEVRLNGTDGGHSTDAIGILGLKPRIGR